MSIVKLKKYISLALNNSSVGESKSAARMFFKRLENSGLAFNPRIFGLTLGQARTLATLGDKIYKGLNDGSEVESKPKAQPKPQPQPQTEAKKSSFDDYRCDGYRTKRDCCYDYFHRIDMEDGHQRRYLIDLLCQRYGFAKTSVQSYASNFRKEFNK